MATALHDMMFISASLSSLLSSLQQLHNLFITLLLLLLLLIIVIIVIISGAVGPSLGFFLSFSGSHFSGAAGSLLSLIPAALSARQSGSRLRVSPTPSLFPQI